MLNTSFTRSSGETQSPVVIHKLYVPVKLIYKGQTHNLYQGTWAYVNLVSDQD